MTQPAFPGEARKVVRRESSIPPPQPVAGDFATPLNEPDSPAATTRISVIIPSYNSGAFLDEALTSVLDQDPPPFEVLVQDGGSTDNTLDILQSFGDRVAWVSASDDGQSDALNKALARATGDIVLWLNADDVILPGAIAAASAAFASDPGLAFAYGDFGIIDGRGTPMRRYRSTAYSWERVYARGCYIFSGSMFVRRDVLLAAGGFDQSLRACMDFDLMLRLGAVGRSRHLEAPIGQLRMHGSNKSSSMRMVFLTEGFRVRRRYARRSLRLWLITGGATLIHAIALAMTPLRLSPRWSRYRHDKTL